MIEADVKEIADNAQMIVNGYSFILRNDGMISILNLNHPDCAMVINRDGEIIETNMDDIEQKIVANLCHRNLQFMEEQDA